MFLPDWSSAHVGREVRAGLAGELARELDELDAAWPSGLPSGVIHAGGLAASALATCTLSKLTKRNSG